MHNAPFQTNMKEFQSEDDYDAQLKAFMRDQRQKMGALFDYEKSFFKWMAHCGCKPAEINELREKLDIAGKIRFRPDPKTIPPKRRSLLRRDSIKRKRFRPPGK
ncbi:MAG: hypothetical protein AABX02_00390 [archaeon]